MLVSWQIIVGLMEVIVRRTKSNVCANEMYEPLTLL